VRKQWLLLVIAHYDEVARGRYPYFCAVFFVAEIKSFSMSRAVHLHIQNEKFVLFTKY
jgi:hypothetical protein